MPFTKETAKAAGSKSKRTKDNKINDIREYYISFLTDHNDKLNGLFNSIAETDPKAAIDILLRIGSLVIPKPRPTDIGDVNNAFLDYSNVPDWIKPKKAIDELTEEEYQQKLAIAKKVIAASGDDF